MSTEVLEQLRLNSHRSVLTSEGMIPGPSGTVIRRSHHTVGSNRSATTDPFPSLPSDLPMPQLTTWLLSSNSLVSPVFLRQVIHNFPSFERSSDLWIFKLDGIPMRCDMPNRCLIILTLFFRVCLILDLFCSSAKDMPSLPSYGMGPRVILLYSDFISSRGNFIGHCSHIVQTSLLI